MKLQPKRWEEGWDARSFITDWLIEKNEWAEDVSWESEYTLVGRQCVGGTGVFSFFLLLGSVVLGIFPVILGASALGISTGIYFFGKYRERLYYSQKREQLLNDPLYRRAMLILCAWSEYDQHCIRYNALCPAGPQQSDEDTVTRYQEMLPRVYFGIQKVSRNMVTILEMQKALASQVQLGLPQMSTSIAQLLDQLGDTDEFRVDSSLDPISALEREEVMERILLDLDPKRRIDQEIREALGLED